MPIYEVDSMRPKIHDNVYIADAATVIGNATLCQDVSVWSGAVVRADNDSVYIGSGTNIQEGAVLHADPEFPLKVGEKVTVGHQAMLHGCTIEDGALIGIQAVVLNGAVIGKNCLVGAGSLVTEGKIFPDNSLILGSPGKVVRQVTDEQLKIMQRDTWDYVLRGRRYRKTQKRIS
ncbi:MAG: gamma carbonic anhydrase family protein [Rhodospirillaceae bacterium]|nr:gamma carbonic anhydrase family protein [Rhodospirillaceae bacterium]|tara:strand:- start:539 stop:1063 length:525 start_codon:yes stop_codon:yes gene_type:complete